MVGVSKQNNSVRAQLLTAIRDGESPVKFGNVRVSVVETGDHFRVEVPDRQLKGWNWDERAEQSYWDGTLLDETVEKVNEALGAPAVGREGYTITIQSEGRSLLDAIGIPYSVVTKPYSKLADAPPNIRELNGAKLTLSQVNWIANMADGLEGQEGIESPWAVAIGRFKTVFRKDGDKWVKRKKELFGDSAFLDDEWPDVVEKALLPLAEKGGGWDADAAEGRVRKWASSDGSGDKEKMNWGKYARAFFYVDPDKKDGFEGYKLPFADVRGGTLKAVPEGVYAAAQAVRGARTPMKIDVGGPKARIAAYYSKMDEEAPWKREKEVSLDAGLQQVRDAFYTKFAEPEAKVAGPYTREIYPSYVIAEDDGKMFKVPYTMSVEGIAFEDRVGWQQVQVTYVPVAETKENGEPLSKMLWAVGKAILKGQKSAATVWREGEEKYYLALISEAVYDNEKQIVTKEGMDCSIKIASDTGYRSGAYIRHVVPQSLVGRMLFERRIGPYWVEVGKFYDSWLANKTFERLEEDKEGKWKISIGFITTREQAEKGVYRSLLKYDTTITDRPALPTTAVLAIGGKEMEGIEGIKKLMGLLNPQGEEEVTKATEALTALFGLEEKEMTRVVKDFEAEKGVRDLLAQITDPELKEKFEAALGARQDEGDGMKAVRAAIAALEDDELKKRLQAAMAAGKEEKEPDKEEKEPEADKYVVATLQELVSKVAALEARPSAVDAIKEVAEILTHRSKDTLSRPSMTAEQVEGVKEKIKELEKELGADTGTRHPFADFAAGPRADEGG